jgi:hypothetical protein
MMNNNTVNQYLSFIEERPESYGLKSNLLSHTKITPANRAVLICLTLASLLLAFR